MDVDNPCVYILFGRHRDVQGVYANETDALRDADYLGNDHYVEPWDVNLTLIAVEE